MLYGTEKNTTLSDPHSSIMSVIAEGLCDELYLDSRLKWTRTEEVSRETWRKMILNVLGFVRLSSGHCFWILKEISLEDLGIPMVDLQQYVFYY